MRLLRLCALFLLALLSLAAPADEEDIGLRPRYLLQDPAGRAITQEDWRGRFQLIAFGYTFCPDVCPTTLVEMADILKRLGPAGERLQPIFITVDPERDTGAVLKSYTEFFHPRILGLTGSPALIRRAADSFKIRYAKVPRPGEPADRYSMDHSAGMILLGPRGEFLQRFAYATPVESLVETLQGYLAER